MLSNKMTVSLMSLITILALAFAVSPALAATFKLGLSYDEAENVTGDDIDVTLKFDKVVSLTEVKKKAITITVVKSDFTSSVYTLRGTAVGADPQPTNFTLATQTSELTQKDLDLSTAGNQFDGQTFTFRILGGAANTTIIPKPVPGETAAAGATKVYVSVAAGVPTLDPGNTDTSEAATLTIDLRDVSATADRFTPVVVSIQRLRPGSQTVVAAFQEAEVTGDFNVRIVLSEAPNDPGNFWKKIKIDHGILVKGSYVIGAPFAWVGSMSTDEPPAPIQGTAVKPHPIEGRYNHDGVVTTNFGDTNEAYPSLAGVLEGLDAVKVPLPTGPNGLYWQCRITVSPHRRAAMVKVRIDTFREGTPHSGTPPRYYYPHQIDKKPNGREQLSLKVNIPPFAFKDGLRFYLPSKEAGKTPRIPYVGGKPGHYIVTRDKNGSHINYSPPSEENDNKKQTPAQMLYNVRGSDQLPNLESFLANDGIIHLVSYVTTDGTRNGAPKYKKGNAYISEVMWGTDASQNPVNKSNWIEIRNGTTAAIPIGEGDNDRWALWFYEAHETPATEYPSDSYYEGPIGQAGTIIDVIGTKASDTDLRWSSGLAGKGQNGRSGIDLARTEEHVLTPTTPLHSMYRMMAADGTLSNGTVDSNWAQTEAPSVNLKVGRENAVVATPGAEPFDTADSLKAAKDKKEAAAQKAADAITNTGTYPTGNQGRVYISEVMFAGGGTLPQWIEIANGDRAQQFNLSGWTITVDNAVADADVDVGARAKFTIPKGTTIDPSAQDDTPSTILIVTEEGRNNLTGAKASGQVINLSKKGSSTEVELILAGVVKGKYTLLSDMAFLITLAPPAPAATKVPAGETAAAKAQRMANAAKDAADRKAATDMVGNLGKDGAAAWALPMSEDGRSSIIRKHVQVTRGPAAPEDGMMMENWGLASDTSFAQVTHIRASSYYGAANDVGTPGFRAGGALPVELSHFRPERKKDTGAVVITWSTQSELNNAGFFIKRSQQKDGEFKVINATMVPGAGTTSEKQFYTYTDTTAQPNVVYYYQIEDVSLDGNRQTLTRGIRLRGHVGATGKLTATWGELKTSHE